MRPLQCSAGSNTPNGPSQLNGSYGHGALPDAHRDYLTCVPFLMEVFHLPDGRWHRSGDFIRQVNACTLREAQVRRVLRNLVDSKLVGQSVVERVTRPWNRMLNVNHAVTFIAGKEVSVEGRPTRTVHTQGLRLVLLQTGIRHDDLERRS